MDWMVTADRTGRRVAGDGDSDVEWPSSVAHALAAASEVTACGRAVDGWRPLDHLVFPVVGAMTCPVCLRHVAVARAELAQSGTGPYIFAAAC
ncbi:MAG: hypothetical protein JWN84_3510 [Nocardioides sp.]|jgi:hypothetical protein|nr:hypothetical protein [Nocardioides sp.]